jgi:hypothetical protein
MLPVNRNIEKLFRGVFTTFKAQSEQQMLAFK